MKKNSRLFVFAILILFPLKSLAEIEFSGYGSVVMGKTMKSDEVFTADFFDVGQYNEDLSFKPESLFAIQARGHLEENLTYTAQLVAKGVDDFRPEFDWYYLTYRATENLSIMAGRRTIPMYYYSEFSEVGYAYPWMRPPSNLYWWQVTIFNGLHASYDMALGDYDTNITLFYGNENSKANKEMQFYFPQYESTDSFWKNITGLNYSLVGYNFDLRFVYFVHDTERTHNQFDGNILFNDFSQEFIGLGGNVVFGDLTILFDYNFVEREYDILQNGPSRRKVEWPTYLISFVYNIGDYQPYVVFSHADHSRFDRVTDDGLGGNDDYEQHDLLSLGFRFNFASSAALKVQYDIFDDQGFEPRGWDFHGDSKAVAIGIDFVF